ncbi:MAG: HisA/HisF-related TIM barrel protein, partial [Verrucomicrobiota bacterium]|nr:HisA/HisF-related TIM barrel protein [Verrucomicrobiota bacterium]
GKGNIVLDLSCRKKGDSYFIVTDRWQKFTDLKINKETLHYLAEYCSEFLIHAVDVEGKQAGIDADLISIMADFSPIKSVYAGGIRSVEDIEFIEKSGRGRIAFTIGSALDIFGGTSLKYSQIVQMTKK